MSSRVLLTWPTISAKCCSVSASLSGPRRCMYSLHCSISQGVRLCFALALIHSRISPSPLPAASCSRNAAASIPTKSEDALVERAVVMILAVFAGDLGPAFVEHARQKNVTAEAEARTARRTLREVGSGDGVAVCGHLFLGKDSVWFLKIRRIRQAEAALPARVVSFSRIVCLGAPPTS